VIFGVCEFGFLGFFDLDFHGERTSHKLLLLLLLVHVECIQALKGAFLNAPCLTNSSFFTFFCVSSCVTFSFRAGFEDLPTFCQISLRVEEEEEEEEEETHSSKIS
jgi:hypothetical protein